MEHAAPRAGQEGFVTIPWSHYHPIIIPFLFCLLVSASSWSKDEPASTVRKYVAILLMFPNCKSLWRRVFLNEVGGRVFLWKVLHKEVEKRKRNREGGNENCHFKNFSAHLSLAVYSLQDPSLATPGHIWFNAGKPTGARQNRSLLRPSCFGRQKMRLLLVSTSISFLLFPTSRSSQLSKQKWSRMISLLNDTTTSWHRALTP